MRYSFVTILKVMLLLALCIAAAFALVQEYYFTLILVVLAILTLTGMLCFDQSRVFRRMEQMLARIRHGDMHAAFTGNLKGAEGALNHSMNEALADFQRKYRQAIVSETETEAWRKLIQVLAHEMMNSLTPIISLSETVIERTSEGKAGEKEFSIMLEAMKTIHRRGRGVVDFVENYRKLARIPDPVMQTFKVVTLFNDVRKLFPGNSIQFTTQSDHLSLYADYSQMEQVLINLIKNGMEAGNAQKETKVWVKAYRDGENTAIRVTDNGVGIEPEALEKIFIPFYTTKQDGSGIGLSLSRQMIVRHKGLLSVTSEVGKGAEFTILMTLTQYL